MKAKCIFLVVNYNIILKNPGIIHDAQSIIPILVKFFYISFEFSDTRLMGFQTSYFVAKETMIRKLTMLEIHFLCDFKLEYEYL